jgi:autotransporter-associated beta strand protein
MKARTIHHLRPWLLAAMVSAPSLQAATFYWDSTNPFSTAGFGNAQGTWAQNSTSGGGRWVTSSTGSVAGNASQGHNVNDIYNFGTAANGLGAGTITVSGTVDMGNTNYGSESGVITLTGGTINYGDARTITVNNTTNNINSTVAGASTSLTKAGAGTLVFGGTNTYTGSTIINAGTLALAAAGSIDSSSGVVLGGGTFDVTAKAGGYTLANLSGSGTVAGALTISTRLAVGTSPGTINFADLTLASSASYVFDLTGGGTAADLANVSGTLTLGNATLDLVQLGTYTIGDKFTLFAYETENLTGTFSGLVDGATFSGAGGLWQINYDDAEAGLNGGAGSSFVTITAVPEPTAALLGAMGALVWLRRRRL